MLYWLRLLVLLAFTGVAQANMTLAQQVLEQPAVVGSARLTVLLFKVYDATLYAPKGQYNPEQSFALSLRYLRAFQGDKIAQRSVEEMRKQGYANEKKLALWHRQMSSLFPDVKAGTELTAVRTPSGDAVFYRGLERIGHIKDPEFSQQFFNIWLGSKSSEPEMRKQLLSQGGQKR
jgi:hypothetical protein